jgi:Family of unknown function (DUF6065)
MPDSPPAIARFYRLIPGTRPPMRADRSAAGTLPTRAYRYCEAVTAAAGFGWWVFPPAGLRFIWDGADIFWTCDDLTGWEPLSPSAQLPGFSDAFDTAAPELLKGCAPPMLTALPEPGTLQIWTGLMVRTSPGWHLLVRAPANLPLTGGFTMYEGIVEADSWFGPLFTNLRFTRTHSPITLRPDFPLLQLQPVLAAQYAGDVLDATELVPDMDGLDDADWLGYHRTIVVPNEDPNRPFGAYATKARRRRKTDAGEHCPFASSEVNSL